VVVKSLLNGQSPIINDIQRDSEYSEEHVHHKTRWYTKKAAQTATEWAVLLSANLSTSFRCISGAGTWGVDGSHDPAAPPSDECFMFGTADTLADLGIGLVCGDFDMILVTANSSNTIYLVRFIWGTGTMADAIAAGQYTTFPYLRTSTDNVRKIQVINTPLLSVDVKIWAQCMNASDNATLDFVVGVHAYNF
jgi:hypothetical protein